MESELVMYRVPEIRFLGTWKQPKDGFLRQIKQGFSSFFAKFDYFSKWSTQKKVKIFEKSSNMAKIWQK